MRRGTTIKHRTEHELVIERKMVTHHDVLTWDLDRCVGCQLGPKVCPKDALQHVGGEVVDGRLASKLLVDVDTTKCIFCGMCVEACPANCLHMGKSFNLSQYESGACAVDFVKLWKEKGLRSPAGDTLVAKTATNET